MNKLWEKRKFVQETKIPFLGKEEVREDIFLGIFSRFFASPGEKREGIGGWEK